MSQIRLKYEDLLPFSKSTNFLMKMREVSDPIINKDTKQSILNAIIDLRRLNKYHYDFFNKIFENIFTHVLLLLFSNDNENFNEIVNLLKEIFEGHTYFHDDIGDWITKLLPKLFSFYKLKNEYFESTKEIISIIIKNILTSETVETLLDELKNCNDDELTNSIFNYLMQCLECFDQEKLDLCLFWDNCLALILGNYKLKGQKGNYAKKIINFFLDKIGRNQFLDICQESMNEETYDLIKIIIDENQSY